MNALKNWNSEQSNERKIKNNLNALPALNRRRPNSKVALPTIQGIHFERLDQIISLEAQGNYTMLHFLDNRRLLVSKTLREIENLLHDGRFIRIHRSFNINLDHLLKYVRGKGGYVEMENGATIAVSAGKKDHFLEMLNKYFS